MLKKVAVKAEPVLHTHRYVVVITKETPNSAVQSTHYCSNLKAAKAKAECANMGELVQIFRATHNFIQAYRKGQ